MAYPPTLGHRVLDPAHFAEAEAARWAHNAEREGLAHARRGQDWHMMEATELAEGARLVSLHRERQEKLCNKMKELEKTERAAAAAYTMMREVCVAQRLAVARQLDLLNSSIPTQVAHHTFHIGSTYRTLMPPHLQSSSPLATSGVKAPSTSTTDTTAFGSA
jgi:hypothetical protein